MNSLGAARGLVFGLLAVLATACSGGDDGKKACTAPNIVGSPFGSTGTGTVHGSGTLPAGLPDGYQFQLLVNQGFVSVGVLPDNLLDQSYTCGRNFSFTIKDIDAGTYKLEYELNAPNSTSTEPAYQGTSTNDFTVADGENVEFTPAF